MFFINQVNGFAFYFEHGTNPLYRSIEDNIKKIVYIDSVFYALPHGEQIITNKIDPFKMLVIDKHKIYEQFLKAYKCYSKAIVYSQN